MVDPSFAIIALSFSKNRKKMGVMEGIEAEFLILIQVFYLLMVQMLRDGGS